MIDTKQSVLKLRLSFWFINQTDPYVILDQMYERHREKYLNKPD